MYVTHLTKRQETDPFRFTVPQNDRLKKRIVSSRNAEKRCKMPLLTACGNSTQRLAAPKQYTVLKSFQASGLQFVVTIQSCRILRSKFAFDKGYAVDTITNTFLFFYFVIFLLCLFYRLSFRAKKDDKIKEGKNDNVLALARFLMESLVHENESRSGILRGPLITSTSYICIPSLSSGQYQHRTLFPSGNRTVGREA